MSTLVAAPETRGTSRTPGWPALDVPVHHSPIPKVDGIGAGVLDRHLVEVGLADGW